MIINLHPGPKTASNPLPSPPAAPPDATKPHWKIRSMNPKLKHNHYWVTLDRTHPNEWTCTCPNYRRFESRAGYSCKHIKLAKQRLHEQMLMAYAEKTWENREHAR